MVRETDVALHPENLNFISLCAGGGGLDLGFELAVPNSRAVLLVEREAYAVAQLVSAMEAQCLDEAPIWSDVRTLNGRPWRGLVDGVIGGIPCQPHSLAGKREGEQDERDLWSPTRRIIVQSGAWFVLIENVGGMLSSGGAERVRRDLLRLGFEVEGGLFTAEEVGASHERERLFIFAVRTGVGQANACGKGLERCELSRSHGERHRTEALGPVAELRRASMVYTDTGSPEEREGDAPVCGGWPKQPAWTGAAGGVTYVGHAAGERSWGLPIQSRRSLEAGPNPNGAGSLPLFPPGPSDIPGWIEVLERAPQLEPSFRRMANELASPMDLSRVDRLRLLGNGVVPLQAAYAIRTLATRLARRGSTSATFFIRMMEAT